MHKRLIPQIYLTHERFALGKIRILEQCVIIEDFFNQLIKQEFHLEVFQYNDTKRLFAEEGTIILLGNNGAQINCDLYINNEWHDNIGVGLLHQDFDKWQSFIDRCNHIDIETDERWGIKPHRKMLSEDEIVSKIKSHE